MTSRSGALPEVADDPQLLGDADDPEDIGRAIGRILGDASLRERMRRTGLERVRQFGWDRAAEGTVAVFKRTLAR